MKYENTDLFEIPFAHETDDNLGWLYRDEGYGGYLVIGETKAQMPDPVTGEEVVIPLGVGIEFIDLESACGEDGWLVEAKLVVSPDSLSDEKREAVAGSMGRRPDEIDYYDVHSYGLGVQIDHIWGAESWEEGYEEIKAQTAFGEFAPGFILDRTWNMIGTNGWDTLRDACFNVDQFDATLERAAP
jgi:hypothetical protein